MKKSISLFLCLTLVFGLSLNLSAQSNQEELNQKELTKQFVGNWVTGWSEGTVTKWNVRPIGNGYESDIIWENEGQPSVTDRGVMGFTDDNSVIMAFIWSSDGILTCDYGKFTSENKIITERYISLNGKAVASFEYEFIDPLKMKMVWRNWGPEDSRENASVSEFIWVKEQ